MSHFEEDDSETPVIIDLPPVECVDLPIALSLESFVRKCLRSGQTHKFWIKVRQYIRLSRLGRAKNVAATVNPKPKKEEGQCPLSHMSWACPFVSMAQNIELETKSEDALTSASSTRPRVQVDFSTDAYKRLQEIKAISGDKTNVEVIRNALRLYGWYLEKKSEDYQLLLAKQDDIKQVELIL